MFLKLIKVAFFCNLTLLSCYYFTTQQAYKFVHYLYENVSATYGECC